MIVLRQPSSGALMYLLTAAALALTIPCSFSTTTKNDVALQDQDVSRSSRGLISEDGMLAREHDCNISLVANSSSQSTIAYNLQDAVAVMQDQYFEVWLGMWPSAIDWTAAMMNTHVLAFLNTIASTQKQLLSRNNVTSRGSGLYYPNDHIDTTIHCLSDIVETYFDQVIAYYFGENAFELRLQAHDDMLWVVLGWLQSMIFLNAYDRIHMDNPNHRTMHWHGKQFEPAYAHRAHIFYDIVSAAWDRKICGGGLTWNPRLEPYKNTITNTLYISAAVSMYLYHPGDKNGSPFVDSRPTSAGYMIDLPSVKPHDPMYLAQAIEAFDWLEKVNLTNSQGLYVDGYHIKGYGRGGGIGTGKCDQRNEMVYTYNQGVILTAFRELWEATGHEKYLVRGHESVRNVINATGWRYHLQRDAVDTTWRGMGRNGVLEDYCDAAGTCSQDAQTFKGIYFHHLTIFCRPLPISKASLPGITYTASPEFASLHAGSCNEYRRWVAWNARGALRTRNGKGLFGMWWNAHLYEHENATLASLDLPLGAHDTRNEKQKRSFSDKQQPLTTQAKHDTNDRGRGRTVESHSGGVAVLRALYELNSLYG